MPYRKNTANKIITPFVDKFKSGRYMLKGRKQNIKMTYRISGKKTKINTFSLAASIIFKCSK